MARGWVNQGDSGESRGPAHGAHPVDAPRYDRRLYRMAIEAGSRRWIMTAGRRRAMPIERCPSDFGGGCTRNRLSDGHAGASACRQAVNAREVVHGVDAAARRPSPAGDGTGDPHRDRVGEPQELTDEVPPLDGTLPSPALPPMHPLAVLVISCRRAETRAKGATIGSPNVPVY